MIPILFDRAINPQTILSSNNMGLGRLNDCISANVVEERNGMFELEIEYPVNGSHFNEIDYCSWIKAKPSVGEDVQLFRVYRISKPINGVCTINAEHVSYMLSYAVVRLGHGESNPPSIDCETAMSAIEDNIIEDEYKAAGVYGFTLTCYNSTGNRDWVMDRARSVREYLMGDEYSLLTVYGEAEYLFDNFDVKLYAADGGANARGKDNGVKIRYGKNMLNLKTELSDENIVTGFYPYIVCDLPDDPDHGWHNQYLYRDLYGQAGLDPPIVMNPAAASLFYFYHRIIPLNLMDFERWKNVDPGPGPIYVIPVAEQDFYDCVNQYIAEHPETALPYKSLEVSFVDLSSTEEYKNIIPLQAINLCDYVTVEYPDWNVNEKFRVVKTEYNVLEERYNSLTLGALRKTLS